ncbi:MAG TPA: hypothetical protein VMT20_14700 [Terriglobia bacterium]|nr:hypothetical protein [Terriglobia bacterium]
MALLLRQRGVTRVRPLEGGLDAWRRLGYPLTIAQAPAENVVTSSATVPEAGL